ncbi:hypothetical protein GQX74_001873 [Glossina fuscipes]|nr:hypothetical protein GQX74_001873 [Glossina fuscipes]
MLCLTLALFPILHLAYFSNMLRIVINFFECRSAIDLNLFFQGLTEDMFGLKIPSCNSLVTINNKVGRMQKETVTAPYNCSSAKAQQLRLTLFSSLTLLVASVATLITAGTAIQRWVGKSGLGTLGIDCESK